MIISQLLGGLGNQLFQYAFGFSISKEKQVDLLLDTSKFNSYKLRDFKLDSFAISGRPAKSRELVSILPPTSLRRIPYLQFSKVDIFKEPRFTYCEEVKLIKQPTYIEGYWQSEKYFSKYAGDIKKEFTILKPLLEKNRFVLNKIKSVNSVSIHIRRGDYASNPLTKSVHGLIGLDYYRAAIEFIKSRVTNPEFFMFSDEVSWVKENLDFGAPVHFVEGNTGIHDIDDFSLMMACKHHILANSTFSWWAAWLGEQETPNKLVVAPKVWFLDPSLDSRDLIPERWLRI